MTNNNPIERWDEDEPITLHCLGCKDETLPPRLHPLDATPGLGHPWCIVLKKGDRIPPTRTLSEIKSWWEPTSKEQP